MNAPDLDIEPLDDIAPAAALDEIEPLDDAPISESVGTAQATVAITVESTAPLAIAEVLPADFPLPSLVRYVPDLALKSRLDAAAGFALAVDVTTDDGLALADSALAAVRGAVKAIEQNFDEPVSLANQLHKSLTSRRAEWIAPGAEAVRTVGGRMAVEQRRREAIAAEARRKAQAEADRIAREAAQKAAEAAKAQGAPETVVEQMQATAVTMTAPPVPLPAAAPPPLAHSTVTKTWKAKIAGTPADADPRPEMADLTPAQQIEVRKLLAAVVAGTLPLTILALNYSALNDRAKAERGTLAIPGIEAYEEIGTRAKAGRRL